MSFQQEDRVFDVAISLDASLLLVGGRDKKARLYKIQGDEQNDNVQEQRENIPLLTFHDDDRIYCVAISAQGEYIAYGGIRKQVHVYQVQATSSILVQRFTHQHTVHRLSFMDNTHLAAVSEDGVCALYKVDSNKPVLHLNLDEGPAAGSGAGNSLAFCSPMKGLLAIAHGCAVTIYGKEFGYGPFDRPSFEVAAALLDKPEALQIALESHPTLTNAFSSKKKKSLLSVAVESGYLAAVELLLDSEVPSGLFIYQHQTDRTSIPLAVSALTSALRMRNRNMIEKLLRAISSKKIVNTEHLFLVGFFSAYCDRIIQSNGDTSINVNQEDDTETVSEGETSTGYRFLRLKPHVHSYNSLDFEVADSEDDQKILVGSVFKAIALYFPAHFLEFLSAFEMEECDPAMLGKIESAQLEKAVRVALPFKSPKSYWYRILKEMEKEQSQHSPLTFLLSRRLPYNVLQAQRISFPGIFGARRFENTLETPLEIIINASSTLQQYSVFDKHTIVHSLVMFYWDIHGPKFLVRTCKYFVYYCCCVYVSTIIAMPQPQETPKTAVFFCVALIFMGIHGLSIEVEQFKTEYDLEAQSQSVENSSINTFLLWRNSLINHFDIWNTLDMFAYSTQLVTNVLLLAMVFGQNLTLLIGFEIVSILLLTWKWFYYAKAFFACPRESTFLKDACAYFVYFACSVYLSTLITMYPRQDTHMTAALFCFALICMGAYGFVIAVKQFKTQYDLEVERQSPENSSTQMHSLWTILLTCRSDIRNALDLLAFFTQLVTNILFLSAEFGQNLFLLLVFEAVSILLLTWKWFYYARAFPAYGPFVRMIQRVIMDMRNFLGFMMLWLLGFALSFHILLSNNKDVTFQTIPQSLWTVLNMLYGDIDVFSSAKEGFTLYYMLFQIMMLSSVVTMLNLLVAILNDAYQKVNENVHAEYTFQLAGIILESVKAANPNTAAAAAELQAYKWVHVLSPKPLTMAK